MTGTGTLNVMARQYSDDYRPPSFAPPWLRDRTAPQCDSGTADQLRWGPSTGLTFKELRSGMAPIGAVSACDPLPRYHCRPREPSSPPRRSALDGRPAFIGGVRVGARPTARAAISRHRGVSTCFVLQHLDRRSAARGCAKFNVRSDPSPPYWAGFVLSAMVPSRWSDE